MTDWLWLVAMVPVVVLFVLVLLGRTSTAVSAGLAVATAVVLAASVFEAPAATLANGAMKGLWLGSWILCVAIPAQFLYRLASQAGVEHLGETFARYLPRPTDRLLLLAWIFPSFVQGVAGFGTPIAVCAPLLLLIGYDKVRAVVLPLIGYHWSVTFGSMGSSFYMASLTAGLSGSAQDDLAIQAATLLAVNVLGGGAGVLLIDSGWRGLRQGAALLLTAGPAMAVTLVVTATAVPAVASLAAGAAGLLVLGASRAVAVSRSGRGHAVTAESLGGQRMRRGLSPAGALVVLAPYALLLLLVLPVFLIPATRRVVTESAQLAPSFPRTTTGRGWVNDPIEGYLPLPVFGHPGFYLVLACLFGWLTYRIAGLWRGVDNKRLLVTWLVTVRGSAPTILILGALAMILVDGGLINTLANGIATAAGQFYPAFAPAVGSLGSFMTGSSTASNALFSALQAEVANLLGTPPEVLVAAQTAGSNVGNVIAPVVVLLGAAAVGAVDRVGEITRRCLVPVAALLAAVVVGVVIRLALTGVW